jgi:hypothetical protein
MQLHQRLLCGRYRLAVQQQQGAQGGHHVRALSSSSSTCPDCIFAACQNVAAVPGCCSRRLTWRSTHP